ncbi:hypothetical protein ACLOJK_025144 [Asimina triloba]
MRHFFRFSVMAISRLVFLQLPSTKSKFLGASSSTLSAFVASPIFQSNPFCTDASPPKNFGMQTEKRATDDPHLIDAVCKLAFELVGAAEDLEAVLDSKVALLLRSYPDGSASVELLNRLKSSPEVGMEVFNWKKNQVDAGIPMLSEEYVKAIMFAGRIKDLDLAADLFNEAGLKELRTVSAYNALMSAYMYNGVTKKSLSIFEDLKRDPKCSPTIVTYNILLSIFGRSMLVDHMETVLRVIKESNLMPNRSTYNIVIAGYVTAWMWYDMERTFQTMEMSPIKPDLHTHLLMLRGYAHSGNLEKMERTYELVKDKVNNRNLALVRAMICAYCRSKDPDRIKKIEALLHFIPKDDYRPWLNVLLIRAYAQEDMVEGMENSIVEALERNTPVITAGVMCSIISSYFRCNAVDKLAGFVRQAEVAGWRICRSLYHCKMVMYGSQNRLEEMEGVLDEMETSNIDPTKKTFLIMYKAYLKSGQKSKVERILVTMCKQGFGIPLDAALS